MPVILALEKEMKPEYCSRIVWATKRDLVSK